MLVMKKYFTPESEVTVMEIRKNLLQGSDGMEPGGEVDLEERYKNN